MDENFLFGNRFPEPPLGNEVGRWMKTVRKLINDLWKVLVPYTQSRKGSESQRQVSQQSWITLRALSFQKLPFKNHPSIFKAMQRDSAPSLLSLNAVVWVCLFVAQGSDPRQFPPRENRLLISRDRLQSLRPYGKRIQALCRGIPSYLAYPAAGQYPLTVFVHQNNEQQDYNREWSEDVQAPYGNPVVFYGFLYIGEWIPKEEQQICHSCACNLETKLWALAANASLSCFSSFMHIQYLATTGPATAQLWGSNPNIQLRFV